jgi:peptidoglycan/LPS O-acetylase OafA/YrhL
VLGAATFSYNWLAVADGTDYFAATAPELFRNFWSLAVEEQFYVVWPLLLPLVLLIPGRWARTALMLIAAAGSAWWMAWIVASGNVTRAYFGTDAHAFGLLIGIALAFAVANMSEREWMRSRGARTAALVGGVVGLAAIIAASLMPETPDAATFPGALLLASGGTAVAIFAGTWPGSPFGRGIDIAPLKWVGDRSYGIYLWHWPVLVLLLVGSRGFGPEAGVPVWVGVLALVVSVIAAAVSYRVVEQPFRQYGFRHALRALGRRIAGTPISRFSGIAAMAVVLVAIGGTTAAVVSAPHTTSAASMITRGQKALNTATETPAPVPTPSPMPEAIVIPDGTEITAVGDSVMLASAPALLEVFPGIAVDAEVSRSIWVGPEILQGLADAGALRDNVIVALGTNGPVDEDMLEQMAQIVGKKRTLILVNAHAPRDWIPGVNADLQQFADSHRGVWVADWDGAITPQQDLLAGDGIHPGDAGGRVFAASIESVLESIENDRLRAEQVSFTAPSGRAPRAVFPE